MGGPRNEDPELVASSGGAGWRCDVCDQPSFRVFGVAAIVGGDLRFWLGGCCRHHEEAVRERRKAESRKLGIPEITVTQLLRPIDVAGWVRRLELEMASNT